MKNKLTVADQLLKCPVQHSLKFIGGKWRMGILWSLKNGCRRFGELKRDVLGITEKMLIQELRHLESLDIISRRVYYEIPPRVEYSLTPRGETLVPVIENIVSWGYADMGEPGIYP
ncbi:MAG: helix-turn-helix transcriptional regulator [Bacteroidales bacterium]|nr:helix-turn-helix transcriptional regulator [Bacteroidales bacterium]